MIYLGDLIQMEHLLDHVQLYPNNLEIEVQDQVKEDDDS
jgi:hypothetical protein